MKTSRSAIETLRPTRLRNSPSPWSIPRVLVSLEPDGQGGQVETTTVFLIGAECPFRCAMCDLWQYTTTENTPVGAIPFQLRQVLVPIPSNTRRWLKLYNASNFFDPRSIPHEDFDAIARECSGFERVIVESHPAFCDDSMLTFAKAIHGRLEVAMGLETIHPGAMATMNKGMTLESYDGAVDQCHRNGIDLRAFVLLHPPGIASDESIEWTWATAGYASQRGVRHVSVIPLRAGNGWIDRLIASGEYRLPTLSMVRAFYDAYPRLDWKWPRTSVFEFDLWDWQNLQGGCGRCLPICRAHIERCNRTQDLLPFNEIEIECECTV